MISYELLINSVSYGMENGAYIILDKTEAFDSGSILVKHITREEPFTEADDVSILIGGQAINFIVQADISTEIKAGLFNHEVTLVEETAKLTKHIGTDRFFTLKANGDQYEYKDHLQVIRDTEPFNDPQSLFGVSAGTNTALEVIAPEKKYQNMTIYQSITEIFRGIKAVMRLVQGTLTHEYYNDLNNPITLGRLTGSRKENDFNNLGLSMKSKAKNVVYDGDLITGATLFPSVTSGVTPRSSTGNYADATSEYQLDNDIRRIIECRIMNLELTGARTIEANIACVSQEEWNGLTLGSRVDTVLYTQEAQRNTLRYSINGNKVIGMGDEFKDSTGLITRDTMEMAIKTWLANSGSYTTADYTSQPISEYEVRFFYQPYVDMDVTQEKQDNTVTKRSMILSNQKDSIVDLGRYANVLSDSVNRMSNGNYTITERLLDYADRLENGDYTADGYQVIKSRFELYAGHIDATYELSINFVTLDGYTSVNREPRPYTIGRDNVNSEFLFTEYIELSTTNRTNNGILTAQGLSTFLNCFDYLGSDDIPVYLSQYTSTDSNQGSDAITMSAIGIGAKGLRYKTGFKDPKLAGNQLDRDVPFGQGLQIETTRYANELGAITNADFKFINDVAVVPDDYPLTAYQPTTLMELNNKYYGLDPNEVLGLTAEQLFTTDEDGIITGPLLSIGNNLIKELSSAPGLVVFFSNADTVYNIYDTHVKEAQFSNTYVVSKVAGFIEVPSEPRTYAIGNSLTGELYYAVNYNGITRRRIYFNNLKERTNINNI